MLRKIFLPSLALLGALVALAVVFWSMKTPPLAPIPYPPPTSPYMYAVAGEGIIEAASENIPIGTPFNEVVTDIYVVPGQFVKQGDLLFKLDTRQYEAMAETARAEIALAQKELEDKEVQYSFYTRLKDKKAVSESAYSAAYYTMQEAKEQLRVAIGNLGQIETNIQRSILRSPIDAEILQINIHPGQIAPIIAGVIPTVGDPTALEDTTLMLLGSIDPLHIRIDIDEEDAWRYRKEAPGTAFLRGNANIHFPLKYVRIEPYVVPKRSFSGDTVERIDTRVLQVIYALPDRNLPVYAGQMMDVFIEASE